MFHKAVDLKFRSGTTLDVWFQDGLIKRYNMASLFSKHPQLKALKDRQLFLSGRLMGSYGIVWNDDLDIEAETIYEDGETVEMRPLHGNFQAANAIMAARAKAGLTQKQLAELADIDQSDLSKIERGIANPSLATLDRIAQAAGGTLSVSVIFPNAV